ncbi:MAG: hypothetical protein LLG01_00695 [Planctomycetaceae bacterium]|nr:hypothetical protein [Planctomycetaceae bacterium]
MDEKKSETKSAGTPKQAKHAGGRPRTRTPAKWSAAQLAKIDRMAMDQCKDGTIADAMGIDPGTFKTEFSSRTHQKRCQGKVELHRLQRKRAGKGSDTMLIWLGKQHLEQSDKNQIDANVNVKSLADIAAVMRGAGDHAGS